jgi:hypothetical protein
MDKSHYKWTTSDEINLLNHLGEFDDKKRRLSSVEKASRRMRLLYGAREAYKKRVVWGDIKTLIVKQHLEMLIRRAND